jgi:hypothetical protein
MVAFAILLLVTLGVSAITSNQISKRTTSHHAQRLPKFLSTSLALTLLFILSPVIEHTNAMDAALVKAGEINYVGEEVALGWFQFPNILNDILALTLRGGASSLLISLLIALGGLTLWFFAYFLAAQSFGFSHLTSLTVAFGLTYWNPFLMVFSPTFGFQAPWVGNSTFGMLGSALVAFGMSLTLIGKHKFAFATSIFAILVSPVSGVALALILVMIGLRSLLERNWHLLTVFLVWFVILVSVIAWTVFQIHAYRSGLGVIDREAFNTYLVDWDGHRNPYRYGLPLSLVASIAIVAAFGVFLSRLPMLLRVVPHLAAVRNFALLGISLSLLLPLIYWALISLLNRWNEASSQAEVLFIQQMPLRLTTNTGFVVIVLLFGGIAVIGSTITLQQSYLLRQQSSSTRNIMVTLKALAGIAFVATSFYLAGFHSRETWLLFLADTNKVSIALSTEKSPNKLGAEVRQDGQKGAGLTMVAPGLSNQILWEARLPILLHTENGIDFAGYLPELADDLGILISEGYGLNFENSPNPPRCGCIPDDPQIRNFWENRSIREWEEFSNQFGVFYIATPADWILLLPQVSSEGGISVYEIH